MHHIHLWCCSHLSWKMVIFSLFLTVRHRNHSQAIEKPNFFRSHFTLYIKQWCPIPSQKLSGILHALLISSHRTELTPARGSAFHRKQSPVKNLLENPFAAQIKQEGKKWWHGQCWATAEFEQICDGPQLFHQSNKRQRRNILPAPGVSSFPRKQTLHSPAVFWQPLLCPGCEHSKVLGQELTPSVPQASHAKWMWLHSSGHASSAGQHCSGFWFSIVRLKKPLRSQVWSSRQDEFKWMLLLWQG